jgi:hypothetical protein
MERADAGGPPFRPRRRGGVFRSLRGGPSSGRAMSPLALLAIAGTLLCFWQVFLSLGGLAPGAGAPLDNARSPLVWFMLGTGCAALIPFAMERRVERKAALKPGALREMAREAWDGLRSWARERREMRRAAKARGPSADDPPFQGR